jgi:hypothetical protein
MITQQQYEKITDGFPRQRSNVTTDNLTILHMSLNMIATEGGFSTSNPHEPLEQM